MDTILRYLLPKSLRSYSRLTAMSVIADAILNSTLPTPLRGVAIGNGWIDARRQYPSYIEFAVKVGLLEENSDVCPLFLTLKSIK